MQIMDVDEDLSSICDSTVSVTVQGATQVHNLKL